MARTCRPACSSPGGNGTCKKRGDRTVFTLQLKWCHISTLAAALWLVRPPLWTCTSSGALPFGATMRRTGCEPPRSGKHGRPSYWCLLGWPRAATDACWSLPAAPLWCSPCAWTLSTSAGGTGSPFDRRAVSSSSLGGSPPRRPWSSMTSLGFTSMAPGRASIMDWMSHLAKRLRAAPTCPLLRTLPRFNGEGDVGAEFSNGGLPMILQAV